MSLRPLGRCLGPPTAFPRAGPSVPWVSLPGPGERLIQGDEPPKRQPFVLCRVGGHGRDRGRELSCGLVMWTSFIHVLFKHTSSTREVWLSSLRVVSR